MSTISELGTFLEKETSSSAALDALIRAAPDYPDSPKLVPPRADAPLSGGQS
jgi:hypothetical protein